MSYIDFLLFLLVGVDIVNGGNIVGVDLDSIDQYTGLAKSRKDGKLLTKSGLIATLKSIDPIVGFSDLSLYSFKEDETIAKILGNQKSETWSCEFSDDFDTNESQSPRELEKEEEIDRTLSDPKKSSLSIMEEQRSKSIEDLLFERIKFNLRFGEIFSSLNTRIPPIGIDIIGNYDPYYDTTIEEFYTRVLSRLSISSDKEEKMRETLSNFDNPTFATQLFDMIKLKKVEIPFLDQFWHDLFRLLFKWTLYMRELYSHNDLLFEHAVKDVKWLIIVINNNTKFHSDHSQLLDMGRFDFSIFQHFIEYEAYDNPQILEKFINHIFSFEHHFHDIPKDLKVTLVKIKKEHFNGNLWSKPLLALMLLQFVPQVIREKIKGEYFPGEKLNFTGNDHLISAFSEFYLAKRDGRLGDKDKIAIIEVVHGYYVSSSMIEFFLKNNLQFRLCLSSDLVFILRLMNSLGLLQQVSSLSKIFKFEFEEGVQDETVWKWSSQRFEEYLNEAKINGNEREKYIALIREA